MVFDVSIIKEIDAAYDLAKKVATDVVAARANLSERKIRNAVKAFREGVGKINVVAIKCLTQEKLAKDRARSPATKVVQRVHIVETILKMSDELNKIVETVSAQRLLGQRPDLAEMVYLKLWSEDPEDIPEDTLHDIDRFTWWLEGLRHYTDPLIKKLNELQ